MVLAFAIYALERADRVKAGGLSILAGATTCTAMLGRS
jgi:hypothetical protein